MIIVEMTLHSARTNEKSVLARVVITNDGTGTKKRGNYRVHREGKHGRKVLGIARVENYPRESYGPLTLLRRALEALDV